MNHRDGRHVLQFILHKVLPSGPGVISHSRWMLSLLHLQHARALYASMKVLERIRLTSLCTGQSCSMSVPWKTKRNRVATLPDFSGTSRFPMSRHDHGRDACVPIFCIKINVCEKGLYIRRTIWCYCTVYNSANVFWAVRLVLALPSTHNTCLLYTSPSPRD